MPKVNKREERKAAKSVEDLIIMEELSTSSMSELSVPAVSASEVDFNVEFAPDRVLSCVLFNGQLWVHIREFVTFEGRTYPSKKGAAFTPARLKVLLNKIEEIDEELRQQSATVSYKVEKGVYKTHLGGGVYATVGGKFHGVDLRRYWVPPKQLREMPTRNGIFLPMSQWRSLKAKLNDLLAEHPEVRISEECFHQNQMGLLDCRECLPFGWMINSLNTE